MCSRGLMRRDAATRPSGLCSPMSMRAQWHQGRAAHPPPPHATSSRKRDSALVRLTRGSRHSHSGSSLCSWCAKWALSDSNVVRLPTCSLKPSVGAWLNLRNGPPGGPSAQAALALARPRGSHQHGRGASTDHHRAWRDTYLLRPLAQLTCRSCHACRSRHQISRTSTCPSSPPWRTSSTCTHAVVGSRHASFSGQWESMRVMAALMGDVEGDRWRADCWRGYL